MAKRRVAPEPKPLVEKDPRERERAKDMAAALRSPSARFARGPAPRGRQRSIFS